MLNILTAAEILNTDWPDCPVAIYCLIDPTNGKRRYVGQSRDPEKRLYQHQQTWSSHNWELATWLSRLEGKGHQPNMIVLEWTTEMLAWEREKYWIARSMKEGCPLLNKNGMPLDIEQHKRIAKWLRRTIQHFRIVEKGLRGGPYKMDKKVSKSFGRVGQALLDLKSALDDVVFKDHRELNTKELSSIYYGESQYE